MTSSRQLAAIMFTDIVGYTALMGKEESRAFKVLEKVRATQQPLVEQFGGKWHKDLGDGTLYSFSSSVKAVECAIAIQQKVNKDADYKLRIGIHLGDVTFSNGDVHGDGVNIASRIQAKAAEGGICISVSLLNSIKGNETIKTRYVGKPKLKNVDEPVKLYQVIAQDVSLKTKSILSPWARYLLFGILLMTFGGSMVWTLRPEDHKQVIRSSIVLPGNVDRVRDVALSHDGSTLVYTVIQVDEINQQMYVRALNSYKSQHIAEGFIMDNPVFSPDDRQLAFNSRGTMKIYSLETGAVADYGPIVSISTHGISWFNNDILYAPGVGNKAIVGNILKLSGNGSQNEIVVSLDTTNNTVDMAEPFFISEFNDLLYTTFHENGSSQIELLDLEKNASWKIISGSGPRYIAPGYLIFKQEHNLVGIPFNPKNPRIYETSIKLLSNVQANLFDISDNGTLVYVKEGNELSRKAVIVSRDGNETILKMPNLLTSESLTWSPDEKKIIFYNTASNSLWFYDIAKRISQVLVSKDSDQPVWFPDGERIVFRTGDAGSIEMVNTMNPENIKTVITGDVSIYPTSISSDGKYMLYDEIHSTEGKNIWLYDFLKKESFPFVKTANYELMGMFSPNDQFVSYCSDETGQFEIYVRRFPDNGEKWRVSTESGTEPLWSKDGTELFYRRGNRIMSVPVTLTDKFDYGKAELVFEGLYPSSSYGITNYDVSNDGQSFLMLKQADTGKKEIRIIVNWFEELKELMKE